MAQDRLLVKIIFSTYVEREDDCCSGGSGGRESEVRHAAEDSSNAGCFTDVGGDVVECDGVVVEGLKREVEER